MDERTKCKAICPTGMKVFDLYARIALGAALTPADNTSVKTPAKESNKDTRVEGPASPSQPCFNSKARSSTASTELNLPFFLCNAELHTRSTVNVNK